MENHEITLQDEHHKQFKIVKVQDVRFDSNTLTHKDYQDFDKENQTTVFLIKHLSIMF